MIRHNNIVIQCFTGVATVRCVSIIRCVLYWEPIYQRSHCSIPTCPHPSDVFSVPKLFSVQCMVPLHQCLNFIAHSAGISGVVFQRRLVCFSL